MIEINLLILIFLFGFAIVSFLPIQNSHEKYFLAWPIGSFITTMCLFLFLEIGSVHFFQTTITVTSVMFIFSAYGLTRIKKEKFSIKTLSKKEKTFLSILIAASVWTLLYSLFWPATDWDALTLYDFRARVIASEGNLKSLYKNDYIFGYPPFTSMLHAWTYTLHGVNPLYLYPPMYISTIGCLYITIREKQSKLWAFVGALIFATTPAIFQHAVVFYTNLYYLCFFGISYIYFSRWLDGNKNVYAFLGAIFLSASSWIRPAEPFWFVLLLFIAYAAVIKKRVEYLLFIPLSIWTRFIWKIYYVHLFPPTSTINDVSVPLTDKFQILLSPGHIYDVLSFTFHLSWIAIGLLLVCWSFLIILEIKEKIYRFHTHLFLLLMFMCIVGGTFILSTYAGYWKGIGESFTRLMLVFVPIVVYTICTSPILKKLYV